MTDRTPLPQQEIPGWYLEFIANIIQQLPRTPEMDKVTAMRWKAHKRLLNQFLSGLITSPKIELSDKRFRIIDTFDGFVPADISEILERMEAQGFRSPRQKLTSGQKLKVDFLMVCGNVSSMDCVNFLENEGALLLGDLGFIFILEEQRRMLRKGMRIPLSDRWTASLGEQNAINSEYPVPGMIGPDYVSYQLQPKTQVELKKEGGILFMFCFRDASN